MGRRAVLDNPKIKGRILKAVQKILRFLYPIKPKVLIG